MEDFEFTQAIFANSFQNQPSNNSTFDLGINVTIGNGNVKLSKLSYSNQTRYELSVMNALQVGFTRSSQGNFDQELNNLILTFNLLLTNTCFTAEAIEYFPPKISVKRRPPKIIHSVDEGGTLHTNIEMSPLTETLTTSFKLEGVENLDEGQATAIFRKIQQIDRPNITPSSALTKLNLDKALAEYEKAMSPNKPLFRFKHVFNCIEFCTNINGEKRPEGCFDKEASRLSGYSQKEIQNWRRFYNRTKHSDKNRQDAAEYTTGLQNLPNEITKVRGCAQKLIFSRL